MEILVKKSNGGPLEFFTNFGQKHKEVIGKNFSLFRFGGLGIHIATF
jgi:hypothetical protein